MRGLAIGLLLLSACDQAASDRSPTIDATPAALTFDGGDHGDDIAKVAHGERLSRVLGCRGCHGDQLTGELFDDDPQGYGIMWASNLTRAVPTMTDRQLRDLMVKGVHPRRPEMWVMPSEIFQHLNEPDLEAMIAYLRTLKPTGEASPDPKLGPLAVSQAKTGEVKPSALLVRERQYEVPVDVGARTAQGRYVATVTCVECHGRQLEGQKTPEGSTPDLTVAAVYTRAEFEALITQGIATGDRTLRPAMRGVAKSRYAHLTKTERDALYAYLKARANRPQ